MAPSSDPGGGSSPAARALLEQRLSALQNLQLLSSSYEAKLKEVGSRVSVPSASAFVRTLQHDLWTAWGGHRTCILLSMMACAVVLGGMSGGLVKLGTDSFCSKLARVGGAAFYSVNFSLPLYSAGPAGPLAPDDRVQILGGIQVQHSFPLGSVEVFNRHVDTDDQTAFPRTVDIQVLYFASEASDLPSFAEANASIIASGFLDGPGPQPGYANILIRLAPHSNAISECLGAQVIITTYTWFVQLNVTATSSAVQVWGNGNESVSLIPSFYVSALVGMSRALCLCCSLTSLPSSLTFPVCLSLSTRSFGQSVDVKTDSAPVTVKEAFIDSLNAFVDPVPPAPLDFAPSLSLTSSTGTILIDSTSAAGVYASSAGNVGAKSLLGICWSKFGICGVIRIAARGKGRAVVTNLFTARSAEVSSEAGQLVMTNVAAFIGTTLVGKSISGDMVVSSLIQVRYIYILLSSPSLCALTASLSLAPYPSPSLPPSAGRWQ
jgi:hypothetical protein